jgi:hypothetical protein
VTEMPVGMNGPRAAVDARHNMKAPTQPEDPDDRLHAAWFAEASSTDGLLAKQVPKQGGGSTSLSTSSLVPVCRLPGEEVRPAPPRRSGVIMIISIGFIFCCGRSRCHFHSTAPLSFGGLAIGDRRAYH